MPHNDIPDRATGSDLTTEDIARSRDLEPEGGRDAGPPVYPGEATRTSDERPLRTEEGTDTPADQVTTERDRGTRDERATGSGTGGEIDGDEQELLSVRDVDAYRSRWHQIQNDFVDDPEQAVQAADGLVADVMRTLAENFADHKKALEGQWNQGEGVDTESLRMALRQYRSFFNRLLTK
ncbi:hypothetical protein [Streptomyces sp. NPDC046712]|uniref:hypothetical protein n=1 Tax=Streptomyces sp. NPDC046712 TaxID=3154802 RepID=UPI0033C30064